MRMNPAIRALFGIAAGGGDLIASLPAGAATTVTVTDSTATAATAPYDPSTGVPYIVFGSNIKIGCGISLAPCFRVRYCSGNLRDSRRDREHNASTTFIPGSPPLHQVDYILEARPRPGYRC